MTAHDNDDQEPGDDRHDEIDWEFDELFTMAELARLLRLPDGTLRYWRNLHIGPPSFKVGRHVRYARTDVEQWLRNQRDAG